jgi:hypothetical protein
MNRFAPATSAAVLFAAACTLGAWQVWSSGQQEGPRQEADRNGLREGQLGNGTGHRDPHAIDRNEGQPPARGFYGWSYLNSSPFAAPLVANQAPDTDAQK